MRLALLAFAFVVGCSSADTNDGDGGTKKNGGKAVGVVVTSNNPSCTAPSNGLCTDYVGATAQASVKQVCTWDGGYSPAACPGSNRVGSCTIGADGDPNQVIRRYYSPMYNGTVAQQDCKGAMGTFSEN